ncbi:MAG: ATP-binding protein [Candidatus Wildermuthbacteria bacterium]|nr:ATP-binding protein [Candidatus Wildermuthbacteria bacterium]
MRIVIAGSHGTGKTTLAKALAKRLSLNYIPDIVREEAAPKGFTINENTPMEVQMWLVSRQWELEKTTPENWIADKSLFDYFIYGGLVLKDKNVKGVIEDIVRRNAKYDFVFYLPIEFKMERDGLRSSDSKFQEEIDRRFKECLAEFGVKYTVLSGSVEERVSQATNCIKNGI